jgi:5-(carboxyamino)imidazole ribonucleotide mutase
MPQEPADVQIVLGSKSDARVVHESGLTGVFDDVGVTYEVSVYSAHRNAEELAQFAQDRRNTLVFIGVAGMAAALPGALAGNTRMMSPIIAVPLDDEGLDSCVSMPPGVPVLTVGRGGDAPDDRNRKRSLKNAAIAACQIVGISNNIVHNRLQSYLESNNKEPQPDVNLEELVK